jgi:dCTP deaminase
MPASPPQPTNIKAAITAPKTFIPLIDAAPGLTWRDESCIQPSSVDLTIDRYFRVFRNHTTPIIDVKENLEELTELVEIRDEPESRFMLHPGEFVLGSTAERIKLPLGVIR